MIDETRAQEIQAEVDGENLPEESARVQELIARDSEAAALYQELKELAETLAALPGEEVPEGLRQAVERTVAWRARIAEKAEKNDGSRKLQAPGPGNVSTSHHKKEGVVKGKYVIASLVAAGIAGAVLYFGDIDFPPKNDEAVGTIGAVKKHRVEQIAEGDVVLGSSESDGAWVPFADFITDAGSLGGLNARLMAFSKDLGARETLDAKKLSSELNAINAALEARAANLEARTFEAMKLQAKQIEGTLAAWSTLDAKSAMDIGRFDAVALEAKDLSAQLQARSLDMAGARERLGAIARELQASASFDARTLDASSRIDGLNKSLEAKGGLDAKSLVADLNAISSTLAAREVALAARTLDARNSYIEAASRLSTDLAGARTELGALSRQLEASSKLDAKSFDTLNAVSKSLEARAADLERGGLAGMRTQFELAARNHETLMGMKGNVELAARKLQSRNAALEARSSSDEIARSLGAKTLDAASRLAAASRNDIGAVERSLGARDAVFGAKTLDAMNAHLGAVSRTLQARASQLESKKLMAIEQQLGSVSKTLEARPR